MEVVAGAMTLLLRKLGELLVGEFNLEKRVRKGVKSLETELALMHATLLKISQVPPDHLDVEVRAWAGKARDLSYDMEDSIDAFMMRVEGVHPNQQPVNRKKTVMKFLKKTTKLFRKGKSLHQISGAIGEAHDLAKELTHLRKRYSFERYATCVVDTIDPRLIDMYKDATELVGIEERRDELIQRLAEGEGSRQQPKTISIVGFGGLGKTTLAKAVYNEIKVQFDCRAFVSVSQTPDIKKIFKDMMYELDKNKFANIHNTSRDEKMLIDELREFLEDKRYLIITDDIWDEKTWRVLRCALSRNSLGSVIITTTRNINVSKACCSSGGDIIHRMEPLSDEDSQRLFHKRIFHSEARCPIELQELSSIILKKCGGVPLAINVIASLLASKQQIKSKDEWCQLLKSIGRGITEGSTVEDMRKILSLSYYDMPSHLKTCLLYLSIFPEDYEIDRKRLISRWIAEGFIHHGKQEMSLFEVGETYFNELVNRNMIQPEEIDFEYKAGACRVHDMVLDLICSLSSEENFVTLWDGSGRSIADSGSKVRRLSIKNTSMAELTPQIGITSMLQVRSFSLFVADVNMMPPLSCFKVLRVLDLECCDLFARQNYINLRHVGSLVHLRYLGLKGVRVGKLPREIGKLQFLQTLDIRDTGINELPANLFRLSQLVRLCINAGTKLPIHFVNQLLSLEELSMLDVSFVSQGGLEELSKLTELRELHFYLASNGLDGNQDKETLWKSIGKMQKLQSLKFTGGGWVNFIPGAWVPPPTLRRFCTGSMAFSTLPKWINASSLPLLSYLKIKVGEMRGEDIQILGMLPYLRFLNIEVYGSKSNMEERAQLERVSVLNHALFPCLTVGYFLHFSVAPSMFPRGAMPMLQCIHFEFQACEISRSGFNLDMSHLPSLRQATVCLWCNGASAEEVQEAEAALRLAEDTHPNCPNVDIYSSHMYPSCQAQVVGLVEQEVRMH